MKSKTIILTLLLLVSVQSFSQKYNPGDHLIPTSKKFKLVGISSKTGVYNYKYIGVKKNVYLFNRKIGDVIVGLKNNIVVTMFYSLIPEKGDVGVPQSTLDLVQSSWPFPLAYVDGIYGANIDDMSISLSRTNNALTFNEDRIMYMVTVRNSLLRQ